MATPSTNGEADVQTLAARRSALQRACRWAPAFGGTPLEELAGYDLVVVDVVADRSGHRDASASEIRRLRADGTLVLAYLSVGSVEGWRHYARSVPGEWTLGDVENWPDERYADPRRVGWRQLMAAEAATAAELGVDGLYLDNLDSAADHPETADSFVALVEGLHVVAPELLLVAQNGLAIADRLPIDGLAHEDVFWRYDGQYRPSSESERERTVRRLQALLERGLPVFTVEYAEPGSTGAAAALRASLAAGFRPAVTVLELDRPPHLTAERCSSR